MVCPYCGKKTVQNRGASIYLTDPPQWDEQEWCGCGYRSEWKRVRGLTREEIIQREWESKNA